MGEYARRTSDDQIIKIGTCQSMTNLRADQLGQVAHVANSLDPSSPAVAPHLRFRFPYPDEDGVEPGAFADFAREVTVPHLVAPEGVEHRGGCADPQRGGVRLVAQRAREGRLILTLRCESCRAMWSETDEESVAPVLFAVRRAASRAMAIGAWDDAAWWVAVGARISTGYSTPPEWALRTRPELANA